MKVLMLVNRNIRKVKERPLDLLDSNFMIENKNFWFFKYFADCERVDVLEVPKNKHLYKFEKKFLHFHVSLGLKALFKYKKYDVVVAHGMTSAIVFAFFKKIFHLKTKLVVFEIGSFNSGKTTGFKSKILKYPSKAIDGIIYHSSFQLDFYKENYPWILKHYKFTRFGADLECFDGWINALNAKNNNFNEFIICIGGLRDVRTLVKAFEMSKVNLNLIIIGPDEKIETKDKRITYLNPIPINELNSLIFNSKFCILPLKEYPFSYGQMTLLQQMYFGKCVVVGKVPCLQDYYQNNVTALDYEPENYEELSKIILDVYSNDSLRQRIGDNAKEFVKKYCNEKNMAENSEILIKEVLADK